MIARLIDEDMLLPLNFDNIPNYQYIDEMYKNTSYDPKTSIPFPIPGAPSALFTTPNTSMRRM